MIFDLIMGFFFDVFEGVLGLLPEWSLPSMGSTAGLAGTINSVSAWFPVTALGLCVAVILSTYLFVFAFRLVSWLYERVPFKMT